MSDMIIKPWEMGEISAGIPPLCVTKQVLVKLAPPREKTVRDGLVATFLMTSFFDDNNQEIKTVEVAEGPGGYEISFPLGKKNLVATKFRGPKSYYKFQKPGEDDFYQIPQEKFSVEYATKYCAKEVADWDSLDELTQEAHIDNYLQDMFLFGVSQDLKLPIEGEKFTAPVVGLQTKLYRVYTPPAKGEKYGNTILTKWHKGKDPLDTEHKTLTEILAVAIYDEYYMRDDDKPSFDPSSLEDDEDTI